MAQLEMVTIVSDEEVTTTVTPYEASVALEEEAIALEARGLLVSRSLKASQSSARQLAARPLSEANQSSASQSLLGRLTAS